MALLPGDRQNFNTLQRAFRSGDAALLECQDRQSGQYTAVICAANRFEDGSIEFVPLARLFAANPYEVVDPPLASEQST